MRRYSLHAKCGHEGCREFATYEADTRADYIRQERTYGGGRWLCVRHSNPDEVLSGENAKRVTEIVSRQEPHGRYFGHSGFVHGPGFRAWAADFPAGTVLRVTAEIILPEVDDV
jgi:hypothetical protein